MTTILTNQPSVWQQTVVGLPPTIMDNNIVWRVILWLHAYKQKTTWLTPSVKVSDTVEDFLTCVFPMQCFRLKRLVGPCPLDGGHGGGRSGGWSSGRMEDVGSLMCPEINKGEYSDLNSETQPACQYKGASAHRVEQTPSADTVGQKSI